MTDNNQAKPEDPNKPFFEHTGIKGRRGPKPKFTIGLADRIFHCARYGMSNAEIGYTLGFHEDQITKWLKSSEVFRTKFEEALNHAEQIVEHSLYLRAKGMKVTERTVKEVLEKGKDGEEGEQVVDVSKTERIVKETELPPDPGACRFWLVNRRPEKWKEKPSTVIQDNRQQLMINFNSQEIANLIINEYPSRAKAISDAVRKVIGFGVEGNSPADRPLPPSTDGVQV